MILNITRYIPLTYPLGPGPMLGLGGVGDFTAYVNGDLQTFRDNPCAPGLNFIGGNCLRSPGSQSTPYGTVAIPLAGPQSNLAIAAGILGGGATCTTEKVNIGAFAYEQNICRDPQGNIIAGADAEAEHAFVQAQLRAVGGGQIAPPLTAGITPAPAPRVDTARFVGAMTPAPGHSPAPTPQVVQTATVQTPVSGAPVAGGTLGTKPQPIAISTAGIPGVSVDASGLTVGDYNAPWLWVAAGVAGLFFLPKLLSKEGR